MEWDKQSTKRCKHITENIDHLTEFMVVLMDSTKRMAYDIIYGYRLFTFNGMSQTKNELNMMIIQIR
jgi:hypothetical protein